MPASASRVTGVDQADCQIHSPVITGRKISQTKILTSRGNTPTQFQIRSSQARSVANAITNPIHNIANTVTANVLSTRGSVTSINLESFITAIPACLLYTSPSPRD